MTKAHLSEVLPVLQQRFGYVSGLAGLWHMSLTDPALPQAGSGWSFVDIQRPLYPSPGRSAERGVSQTECNNSRDSSTSFSFLMALTSLCISESKRLILYRWLPLSPGVPCMEDWEDWSLAIQCLWLQLTFQFNSGVKKEYQGP